LGRARPGGRGSAERAPRLQHQLAGGRWARGRILGHALGDHLVHRRREVRADLRQARRRIGEVRHQDPVFGGPHVRDLAGEALAQHGRQRVHVAARGGEFATGLLGGDVVDRADELAGLGHRGVVVALR